MPLTPVLVQHSQPRPPVSALVPLTRLARLLNNSRNLQELLVSEQPLAQPLDLEPQHPRLASLNKPGDSLVPPKNPLDLEELLEPPRRLHLLEVLLPVLEEEHPLLVKQTLPVLFLMPVPKTSHLAQVLAQHPGVLALPAAASVHPREVPLVLAKPTLVLI